MTMEQLIGLAAALILMLIGTFGTFIPGVPGAPLVFGAAAAHRMYFGAEGASYFILAVLFALMCLSLLVDYLATVLGAKKMGATWRGITGALVGGVVGIFFSLPGLILGPFVGAVLFELLGGRQTRAAIKSGTGALIGFLLGSVGRFACCLTMTILFAVNVYLRNSNVVAEAALEQDQRCGSITSRHIMPPHERHIGSNQAHQPNTACRLLDWVAS